MMSACPPSTTIIITTIIPIWEKSWWNVLSTLIFSSFQKCSQMFWPLLIKMYLTFDITIYSKCNEHINEHNHKLRSPLPVTDLDLIIWFIHFFWHALMIFAQKFSVSFIALYHKRVIIFWSSASNYHNHCHHEYPSTRT